MPTYVVSKDDKDPLQSTIEKTITEHKVTFQMGKVKEHMENLAKAKKELESNIKINEAKIKNIEKNHEFIKKMSEQDLFTCHLYQEQKAMVKGHQDQLNPINASIKEYETEIVEITKQTGIEL